jgi:hypothetical protein
MHDESGYRIKKVEDYYFLNRGVINYSFPQLHKVPLNHKLVNNLKWRYLISVIKTEGRVKNNYEYILTTNSYDIDEFRKKTRTTIRKSLKTCEFKKPPFNDLVHQGIEINRQTLKIQQRNDKFLSDLKLWENYIRKFYDNEHTIVLGAYLEDKMIGYAIAYELEEKYYFHLQHIDRDYGTYYPMSGLMYTIIKIVLDKNKFIEISDGIESFNPLPSLNRFKTYMRFNRVPITRVYILHPFLVAICKPILFYYLSVLGKKTIRSRWVRKIITLYQGNRLVYKIISETSDNTVSTRECK